MNPTLWPVLFILGGLVLLVLGGELLVRGASLLALRLKISPLIIGLTVVAFGTSAPELGVSLQAAMAGSADVAIGNVVGSNIFNVLFILGLSALVTPLVVSSQLIRYDVPLMVLTSLVLWGFCQDQQLSRWEGVLLFASLLAYVIFCIRQSQREPRAIVEEFAQELPKVNRLSSRLSLQLALIGIGLVLLGLGSRWLVEGAVAVARTWGVSELIIGLTIVAAGTSLPEVVTSVVASLRGERDIAVGNVVGSNLFNIMAVLGLTGLLTPGGVPVSAAALAFDMPVMVAVAAVCLPIFFSESRISRTEGALLLLYYVAYTALLILAETHPQLNDQLAWILLVGVLPATGLLLLLPFASHWRRSRATPPTAAK